MAKQAPPAPVVEDIPVDPGTGQRIEAPVPHQVEEIKMPIDPSGYVTKGTGGLFTLIRLFIRNIITQAERQQCIPAGLKDSRADWPLLRRDGREIEQVYKMQFENYLQADRDLILSQHGYEGGYDPQRARNEQLQRMFGDAAGVQARDRAYPQSGVLA